MQNLMVFGDSFTWGEGLELYIDTPKWISQRQQKSEWDELFTIQDEDSKNFREYNRYPAIVARHFKTNLITDPNNGGSMQSLFRNLFGVVNSNISNSILILQFSSFTRNLLHCHNIFDENLDCPCEFCMSPGIFKESINFFDIYTILDCGTLGIRKYELLKTFVEKEHGIDFNNKLESLYKLEKLEIEYYKKHFDYLINKFLLEFEKSNIKVHFIDSWEDKTSSILFSNEYFKKNLIPLIGNDDTEYLKYSDWELTFEHKRIEDEFPKTQNHHPTLTQHRYLANSIIHYISEKYLYLI